MITLTILWAVLASAVAGLALYRKYASRGEDGMIHMRDFDGGRSQKQSALARTLDSIDRWGKALTIAVVAYGLILLGCFMYMGWEQSQRLVLK